MSCTVLRQRNANGCYPSGAWAADAVSVGVRQCRRVFWSYYSLTDMTAEAEAVKSGRTMTCGTLTFVYHGERAFRDAARGSDDSARLAYVMNASTLPNATIENTRFDTWVHHASGATVVTPAGYARTVARDACELRSITGPFIQVIWGATASDATEVQVASTRFEQTVMMPLAPYQFGFQYDPALTTIGPQFRENGPVFNRKGFLQAKQFAAVGSAVPMAHTFETLIAKNGSFVGVGTLNDDVPAAMALCSQSNGQMPGYEPVMRHLKSGLDSSSRRSCLHIHRRGQTGPTAAVPRAASRHMETAAARLAEWHPWALCGLNR